MAGPAKFNKEEVKSLFKKADGAERELRYAFGLGKSPDDSRLVVHKSLKGKALATPLIKEGCFKKVGYGSIRIEGTTATFTENKAVGHLVKVLRADLRKIGYRIELTVEDEGAGGLTPEERREWMQRMKALEADVDVLLQSVDA